MLQVCSYAKTHLQWTSAILLTKKQVFKPGWSVISKWCCNVVLCSSCRESSDGIVWLRGSAGQLVWVGASSLQSHLEWESAGLGRQDQWATGHAPLGSFLIQSQAEEDLYSGADSADCLQQSPTEPEEFAQFLDKVKDWTLFPPPQCSAGSSRWWFIVKWMLKGRLWKCPSHSTVWTSHKLLPFEEVEKLHFALLSFYFVYWIELILINSLKSTYQLLLG